MVSVEVMGTFRSGDKHIIPRYNPLIPKGKREGESQNCEMLTRGSKELLDVESFVTLSNSCLPLFITLCIIHTSFILLELSRNTVESARKQRI